MADDRSLPQAGHAAPRVLRDFDHLMRSMRSLTSTYKGESYAERQERREAEINGLKRTFDILESETSTPLPTNSQVSTRRTI